MVDHNLLTKLGVSVDHRRRNGMVTPTMKGPRHRLSHKMVAMMPPAPRSTRRVRVLSDGERMRAMVMMVRPRQGGG